MLAAKAPSLKTTSQDTIQNLQLAGALPSRFAFRFSFPTRASFSPPQNLLYWLFRLPSRTYAHRHPISGYSDHWRAARSRRAMGFPARSSGGMRVPPGSLHVCGPSPHSWTHSNLQHGQWRPVRIGISRPLPELAAQHFDLCAHRTPLVESARALEFWSQPLRLKPVAIPCADS